MRQALLLLLLCTQAVAAPQPNPSLPDLVEKVLPGVVNVSSTTIAKYRALGMDQFMRMWGLPQERSQSSLGSGFLIDKDGFIITNYHVVAQADEVLVNLLDKRQFRARIVGKDQKMDLALLQIRDPEKRVPVNLQPVVLGNSDVTRIAESVFAVGNPFGLQHTVTTGIISAKNRTVGQGPFDNFLQTDASINPGNSGGPLFNLNGEVIGINTMILSRTEQSAGVGLAIPVNEAKAVLEDLKKYGRVPRPWLGIQAEKMNPQIQEYYNLASPKGVLVFNIVARGPSDRAGLQQGDIILNVGEVETLDPYDVERTLAKLKSNTTTSLKVQRGKKRLDIKVKLQELPPLDNLPQGII